MINLLILMGAVLVALRMIAPLLRIAINVLAKVISFTFFMALLIILILAILTHGVFI